MRISDWSSDVCSSDLALPLKPWLRRPRHEFDRPAPRLVFVYALPEKACNWRTNYEFSRARGNREGSGRRRQGDLGRGRKLPHHQEAIRQHQDSRSEENTSELQSIMRSAYAVFCLQTKTHIPY